MFLDFTLLHNNENIMINGYLLLRTNQLSNNKHRSQAKLRRFMKCQFQLRSSSFKIQRQPADLLNFHGNFDAIVA